MKETYPAMSVKDLHSPTVFVIDMVKGFTEKGALADPAIEQISPAIRALASSFPSVFVCDTHPADCREFTSYPPHCIEGTQECEVTDSLSGLASVILPKNSTNTFSSPAFQSWLAENGENVSDFILTGCCTDLCVLQFALSLQAWLNEHNMTDKRVIVPANAVATYHIPEVHDAAFWDAFALKNMQTNGITVVGAIEE